MKHVKIFEQFVNELFVRSRDVEAWEKKNGKLPFPKEVLAATKKMQDYGLADDDQLTRAHIWLAFNDSLWTNMEKFGEHVRKFYGSDFYSAFSSGYDHMSMKAKYYAAQIISMIEDMVANREEIEPAYYIAKEYFNNFGLKHDRNRMFDSTVKHVEDWINKNNIETL